MKLALDGSNTAISDWIIPLNELYISTSWKILLGYSDEELPNKLGTWLKQLHPDDRPILLSALREDLKNKKEIFETTYRLRRKDGSYIWVLGRTRIFYDKNGKPYRLIGTQTDITKRKLLEEMLYEQKESMAHLAHHDTLTQLPNRILLHDRLNQAIQKAKREKKKFAVLFLDLDHFKEINDTLGHDIGDKVLKEVATRFQSVMREEDTLARLGGDEFTIIMENLQDEQDASVLAQKLLHALAEPVVEKENTFYLSCSIGISLYPADGTSVQNLLKNADAAMYKAKEEGRSNFQFYSSEMTTLAFERVVMEASMRAGLKNGEFEVYYQPQLNAKKQKVVGMEALVRWNHPNTGLVFPSKFIPLAESTGFIIELDRYVIKTAMMQISRWYKEGLSPGVLALNLSSRQIRQQDSLEFLTITLAETECKAEWVEFEVTENELMQNMQEAIVVLTKMSKLGIAIAIDDFGTGYSSLSYLKKLPIDKLKIDQSFVQDLPNDAEDAAIIRAIIALAKALHLDLIAEGVEREEQKEFCVQNGCENIQGFYYSKAITKEKMQHILQVGLPDKS
ncbi:EAL domain-containing protein [Sulfurimonas paralvinellae]|uniref:EAL domain-containing protein n=2 Tax=Sulfurimonas paralvinellae TaxID=317658 RepID=A0A7M1BAH8_9BACT|nr:EAL domain-containing protein [Sulfurimonas paralvinellae]